jgi:hypothetical protein
MRAAARRQSIRFDEKWAERHVFCFKTAPRHAFARSARQTTCAKYIAK